jgi:rubredoxin
MNGMFPSTGVASEVQPQTQIEKRKRPLRCRDCGSSDLWRIDERKGIVAAIMRYRKRNPFQCRACGWICYRAARRLRDNAGLTVTNAR